MIGTIIFFGGCVGILVFLAVIFSYVASPNEKEKERELEEIKQKNKTFWSGHI